MTSRTRLGADQVKTSRSGAARASSTQTLATTTGGAWTAMGPAPIVGNFEAVNPPPGLYGPNSGRVTSLVVDPTNSAIVYAGTAGGGVWKTTNSGGSWAPLTDSAASLGIGALAINSTGQEIYAGTGEDNFGQDSEYGQGVLKSTNGGASWTLLGNATLAGLHIGGMAIDRSTSGATEHVFATTDAGLYESVDGGNTWNLNANFQNAITGIAPITGGAFDIFQDPVTATRFYASVGDQCQTEYGQILVSNDGGQTWPTGDPANTSTPSMRPSVGVGPNNTAYAAFADCNGNLLKIDKSTTGGTTWSTVMASGGGNYFNYFNIAGNAQGWYDNFISVDPTNASRAIFGGITVLNTTDGGATYQDVGHVYDSKAALHPDFHAGAFTGANTLYIGNDGGVYFTTTLGGTSTQPQWTDVNNNLGITQFYRGTAVSTSVWIGGAQDNGDPGRMGAGIPPAPSAQQYGVGDGVATAIAPGSNGANFYFSVPDDGIFKQTNVVTNGLEANPTFAGPCNNGDPACADPKGFVSPFVMDAANANNLLAGTNHIYKSITGGLPAGTGGWTAISGDLSNGSGSDFLTTIAVSPTGGIDTVFTGSAGGTVSRTTNGSAATPTWTTITGNLPQPTSQTSFNAGASGWISSVAFNPNNNKEAWVALGNAFGVGRLWHTVNADAGAGTTWSDLTTGGSLPINAPIFSVRVDPNTPTTVYVGTTYGAYSCTNCGGATPSPTWTNLGTGLPNVEVYDLVLSTDGQSLVAYTHGRGAWEMALPGGSPPPGLLRVTTNPAVGARISLTPSGSTTPSPLDQWGVNWLKLGPGNYTVTFADSQGFETATAQPATITSGATTTIVGNYIQDGFLRVQISPAGLAGTISVDSTPRDDYGMWQYLPPGSHQVCFGLVANFTPPACQSVVVTAGATTNITGTYVSNPGASGPTNFGMLRVTTNPAVGARISLTPSGSTTPIPMDQWGLSWAKLTPGNYTVSFSDVAGFETPAAQSIAITNGATTTIVGNYIQDGFLRVMESPAGADGTILVDGSPRDDYGMWQYLPTGSHTVCFGQAPGYVNTPACQSVAVTAGATTTVTGTYS